MGTRTRRLRAAASGVGQGLAVMVAVGVAVGVLLAVAVGVSVLVGVAVAVADGAAVWVRTAVATTAAAVGAAAVVAPQALQSSIVLHTIRKWRTHSLTGKLTNSSMRWLKYWRCVQLKHRAGSAGWSALVLQHY